MRRTFLRRVVTVVTAAIVVAAMLAGAGGLGPGSALGAGPRRAAATRTAPVGTLGVRVGPQLAGCPVFPTTNVWNRRVDGLPKRSNSATMISAIGASRSLHPDFSDADTWGYGIPYNIVTATTPRSMVAFDYDDES